MNYELCKKLKDTGFPQDKSQQRSWQAIHYDLSVKDPHVTIPTLSELIEVCGEEFESLVRVHYPKGNIYYQAYPTEEAWEKTEDYKNYPCMMDCCGYRSGDTPEEAVANLWLALNSKEIEG